MCLRRAQGRGPSLLAALACVFAAAAPVHAQDVTSARALGLGDAYRAIATGNDAITMNPAGLVVIPRYSPEVHYRFDLVAEQHQVDASVVDSKTSALAAGLAYTFDGRPFTRRASTEHTATLALAFPLVPELLSLGAGLKYVNITDAVLGNYFNAVSADAGVLSRLPGGLSLAAVGYNLIPLQSARAPVSAAFAASLDLGPLSALLFGGIPMFGAPMSAAGLPTPTTLGTLRGPLSGLVVAVDWQVHFATLYGDQQQLSAGAEYLAFDSVPLRAGYTWRQEDPRDLTDDDQRVSVGAGFIVPYFGLDVAYQQSIEDLDTRLFAVALKFFLPM